MTAPTTPWSNRKPTNSDRPQQPTSETPESEAANTAAGRWSHRPELLRDTDITPMARVGMMLGIGIALAVAIVAVHSLFAGEPSPPKSKDAAGASASAEPEAEPTRGSAFAIGRVLSNDGRTLRLGNLIGGPVTVRTNASTRVLVLATTQVSEIYPGGTIMVHGDRASDGSIVANGILGVAPAQPGH